MDLEEALKQLRDSCYVVTSPQIQALQSIVATLHVEETTAARLLSLCEEMMRSSALPWSEERAVVVEERRLLQTYGFPFVEGNQPTLNFLIVAGALLILTILWEVLFLRSTMACIKHVESFGAAMTDRIKDLGGMLAEVLNLKGDMLKLNTFGATPRLFEESLESSHETEKETWTRLFEEATKLTANEKDAMNRDAACDCEVSFEDVHFTGKASEGEVTVSLVRRGHCVGALEVKVRPHPSYVEDADEMSTLQTSRVEALLLQAANKTNTSVHVGYFQQLSADVAKEGVFHYFSTRLAFWIGLVTSILVMSVLNIWLCPTSGDQMIDETFGDVAEAWVPIHKAPKFVGSPLQSPYFGTSPYHAAGYAPGGSPGSPSSHQTSFSPTSSP